MSHATELRTVRVHFGLRQLDLALWLGITRARLASIETGREPLPSAAQPWLRPWAAALALPADEATEPAPPPVPAALLPALGGPAAAVARLHECDYQAGHLHQQHLALLTRHRLAVRHLAAGLLLRATLPPETAPEPLALALRRRWLARLLETATDTLRPEAPAGPTAAVLLGLRGGAYRHEAAALRAWLAGRKPPRPLCRLDAH
ncbi:helix-turn-helix transcriptional regulator [Hymenobacter elongatus]|uniref:helix-turn-helix transcriptional regulator n=1 Tax=Hymenobacter elongatus TaxID=877208 RepID=UPI00143675C7|nr:helix-turn-helix transcriptional regulator [Hymenobacter elongatus]